MKSFQNKKIAIGLGLIIIFSFLVIVISLQYGMRHEKKAQLIHTPEEIDLMTKEEIKGHFLQLSGFYDDKKFNLFQIIPVIAFIGLILGIFEYYLVHERITKQDLSLQQNSQVIFRFLSSSERKIIKYLVENKGKANQYELSHLQGLDKFRTHRIIRNLEEKGVISKNKVGKVNKIILNSNIYKFLEK